MSPPASNDAPIGPGSKPKSNIYTILMAIALVLIIFATVLLWLEMGIYEYKKDAARGASPRGVSIPSIALQATIPEALDVASVAAVS